MKKNVCYVLLFSLLLLHSCTKAVIDEGDVNNLPPLEADVRYNPEVQGIMFNNCITCHGGPSPQAGLNLNNYQNVRFSAENGNLISRMNNSTNPMPPSGILSAEIRQQMDKWVQNGFPEN